MKSRLILLILLFVQGMLTSQAQPRLVPTTYPSSIVRNYTRTWDAAKPELNISNITTQVLKDVKQSTLYIDGLGRPLQTVIKEGSLQTGSTATDLISAVEYDVHGREKFKYLPLSSTTNDGNFKLDPFLQQANFYGDPNG